MTVNVIEFVTKFGTDKASLAAAEAEAEVAGKTIGERFRKSLGDQVSKGLSGSGQRLGSIGGGLGIISGVGGALGGAGPLAAAGAGLAAFGAIAVPILTKVHDAQTKLTAAQLQYAKATTAAGRASALKAEQQATEGLTGSQKAMMQTLAQASKLWDSLENALSPIVGSVLKLAVTTGKDLMPAITMLAKSGASVITSFLVPFDKFLQSKLFAQFVGMMAQFAVQVGRLVGPQLVQLLKLFTQLFIQILPSGMQILTILIPLIVQLVGDLVPAIVVIAKVTAAVLQWLVQTRLLKPVLLGLIPVIMLLVGSTGIGSILIALSLLIAGIVEVSRNWKKIWGDIKKWTSDAVDWITNSWGKYLFPGLYLIIKIAEWTRDHWKTIWEVIKQVTAVTVDYIRGVIKLFIDFVTFHWSRLGGDLKSMTRNMWSDMNATVKNYLHAILTALMNWISSFVGFFRRLPGQVLGALRNLGSELYNVGRNAVEDLRKGAASVGGGVINFFKSIGLDIWHGIQNVLHMSPPHPGSAFYDLGVNIMHHLESGAKSRVGSAIGNIKYSVGAGVEQWRGLVMRALSMEGLSPMLAGRVLFQMQTESGGNPNAINNWDSNAAAGDPSRGLLQTIMSTFLAYHWPGTSMNIYDPLANIAAAINYARNRYGPTLMSGGMGMGSGHGYDQGGWLPPGVTLAVNRTGQPERVIGPGGINIVFEIASSGDGGFDAFMLKWLRNSVRIKGGGSVQRAFGRN